ncbi:hypothetical protein DL93DRAFT_2081274 [Clavulina sp. PMI_390]|nr:hypothetical protein DL93DRAFT_2081274 [Clavulina sp. PMI_390]
MPLIDPALAHFEPAPRTTQIDLGADQGWPTSTAESRKQYQADDASGAHAIAASLLTSPDGDAPFRALPCPSFTWKMIIDQMNTGFFQSMTRKQTGKSTDDPYAFPTKKKGRLNFLLFRHEDLVFATKFGHSAFTVHADNASRIPLRKAKDTIAILTVDISKNAWHYIGVFKQQRHIDVRFTDTLARRISGYGAVDEYPLLGDRLEEYFASSGGQQPNRGKKNKK